MRCLLILPLLLLTLSAQAKDLYHIHHLTEKERIEIYTAMLHDGCVFADGVWHEWPEVPGAGYWGTGRSDNMNEGIRAIAGMCLASGTVLKYSKNLSPQERAEFLRKEIAAIRYATASHLSGPKKCTDGKPWGGSWQSAMWTSTIAFGAWLVRDDIDASLQKDLERVVASEADRFLLIKPPAGSFNDTKAEENGWDLTGIAIAANMFPKHPHAAAWREKAAEYAMNTLSAPQDKSDSHLVDGKPVSEWFTGANVHADFTLENHGFFHPSYIGCSSYFLTQSAMQCVFAHQPIPEAYTHHLMDTWRMYQSIILPWGEAAYTQGMDWELHNLPYLNLFASLASYEEDPLAARMENQFMQYMREWQVMCHGDFTLPGSRLAFTRHAICAEQAAYSLLAHEIFGPPVSELSAKDAAKKVEGVRLFDDVQVVTHRTEDKFVSFSWTNRLMGMLIPTGPGHESEPIFTVPMVNGFCGAFDLVPRGDTKSKVMEHSRKKTDNGFETSGVLLLNGGRLKETLQFKSIGKNTVVYQDRVIAEKDVTIAQERGVPIGIENDELSGGVRTVFHENGETVIDWKNHQGPVSVSGTWVNVDGRMGEILITGTGLTYVQSSGYQPGISVCTDVLYSSYSNQPRKFKAKEEVAHRAAILFTEVSPRKTESLSRSVKILDKPEGRVVHFKLPEGGEAEVSLE